MRLQHQACKGTEVTEARTSAPTHGKMLPAGTSMRGGREKCPRGVATGADITRNHLALSLTCCPANTRLIKDGNRTLDLSKRTWVKCTCQQHHLGRLVAVLLMSQVEKTHTPNTHVDTRMDTHGHTCRQWSCTDTHKDCHAETHGDT